LFQVYEPYEASREHVEDSTEKGWEERKAKASEEQKGKKTSTPQPSKEEIIPAPGRGEVFQDLIGEEYPAAILDSQRSTSGLVRIPERNCPSSIQISDKTVDRPFVIGWSCQIYIKDVYW
jgi:hypothetical protein